MIFPRKACFHAKGAKLFADPCAGRAVHVNLCLYYIKNSARKLVILLKIEISLQNIWGMLCLYQFRFETMPDVCFNETKNQLLSR